jgi:hypothetical protein
MKSSNIVFIVSVVIIICTAVGVGGYFLATKTSTPPATIAEVQAQIEVIKTNAVRITETIQNIIHMFDQKSAFDRVVSQAHQLEQRFQLNLIDNPNQLVDMNKALSFIARVNMQRMSPAIGNPIFMEFNNVKLRKLVENNAILKRGVGIPTRPSMPRFPSKSEIEIALNVNKLIQDAVIEAETHTNSITNQGIDTNFVLDQLKIITQTITSLERTLVSTTVKPDALGKFQTWLKIAGDKYDAYLTAVANNSQNARETMLYLENAFSSMPDMENHGDLVKLFNGKWVMVLFGGAFTRELNFVNGVASTVGDETYTFDGSTLKHKKGNEPEIILSRNIKVFKSTVIVTTEQTVLVFSFLTNGQLNIHSYDGLYTWELRDPNSSGPPQKLKVGLLNGKGFCLDQNFKFDFTLSRLRVNGAEYVHNRYGNPLNVHEFSRAGITIILKPVTFHIKTFLRYQKTNPPSITAGIRINIRLDSFDMKWMGNYKAFKKITVAGETYDFTNIGDWPFLPTQFSGMKASQIVLRDQFVRNPMGTLLTQGPFNSEAEALQMCMINPRCKAMFQMESNPFDLPLPNVQGAANVVQTITNKWYGLDRSVDLKDHIIYTAQRDVKIIKPPTEYYESSNHFLVPDSAPSFRFPPPPPPPRSS